MDKKKQLWDFMNSFIDEPITNYEAEYDLIEANYSTLFNHGVPREMIPSSISEENLKSAMQKCIDLKTDNLLELLGLDINTDHLY